MIKCFCLQTNIILLPGPASGELPGSKYGKAFIIGQNEEFKTAVVSILVVRTAAQVLVIIACCQMEAMTVFRFVLKVPAGLNWTWLVTV